jgi:cell division protein FtsB
VIAIVTVAAVLAISFVSSYSVYLGQQRDIAQVKAEIARHNAEIGRLNDELARWEDPAYVRAQARDRLGWVLPGEVGYRVIDADGNVIGGTVSTIDPSDSAANSVWYEALWLSIQTADRPEPSRPGSNPVNPNPAPDQDPGSTGSAEAPNGTSSGEGTDRGGFKTNRSPR